MKAFGARHAGYGKWAFLSVPAYSFEEADNDSPVGYVNLHADGSSFDNHDKTRICKGGKSGWVGLHGLQSLSEALRYDSLGRMTVWKLEGIADALALWSAIPSDLRGLHCVITGAAGTENPKGLNRLVGVARVNVVGDADKPGREAAGKWCNAIAAKGIPAVNVPLPYETTETKGKDLRDWLNAGNDFAALERLVRDSGEAVAPSGSDSSPPVERLMFGELLKRYPTLRPYVINGLIRLGQTLNLVSSSKANKTWTVLSLALSIILGLRWLGHFDVAKGRVLLIDNELHPEDIAYRLKQVCDAMGIDPADHENEIEVWALRGDLRSLSGLQSSFDLIEPGEFKLIILDAKYRFAEPGDNENDNNAETQFYNRIDALAKQLDAAFVLVHHASKGDQSGKAVTDMGAGAGAQSRAVDCHLTIRPHKVQGAVVLDSVTRSFPPQEPVPLRWEHPIWVVAEDLDPAELRPASNSKEAKAMERMDEAVERVRLLLANASQEGVTVHRLVELSKDDGREHGMGRNRVEDALRALLESGDAASRDSYLGGKATLAYSLSQRGPLESVDGPTDCTTDGGPLVSPSSP